MVSKESSRLRYLLLLIVGAAIVVGILSLSCRELLGAVNDEILGNLETETVISSSEPVVTPTRLIELQEMCTASVPSDVFLRRDVSIRLLGLKLYSVEAWQLAVGTVTAAVDLSEADITMTDDGGYEIALPDPVVSACHIDYEASQSGNDLQGLPFESAEDVAAAQDDMTEEAIESLRQAAMDAGILKRARENTSAAVADLVHSLDGEDTPVHVTFRASDEPAGPSFTKCEMGPQEVSEDG